MLALLISLAGCGAKTGLELPDAQVDAGRDAGTDAGADAGPRPVPCIEAPREVGEVRANVDIPASLAVIDLMFLIDSTGSMTDEIRAVRRGLREFVVPQVRAAIPDAAFGLALFGEFPIRPHGPRDVAAYQLRSPITTDVPRVEAAFDGTPTWGNFDDPEAAIEGLYQVATGNGYGAPGDLGFIAPSTGCPTGGSGGACFRPEALPIVMLITDAPMHNGPPGVAPSAPYTFAPVAHGYEETLEAVAAHDALVVTLGASDPGRPRPDPHLRQLSIDTGSVDGSGAPLFFDIGSGGNRIGQEIVSAVQFIAAEVPLDVDAIAEDVPGDDVNADDVLRGVEAASAAPMSNVTAIEDGRFIGVIPGTVLTFNIRVDASELPPSASRRVYPIRVIFRASGRSQLEVRRIDVVVPGDDGLGCEME